MNLNQLLNEMENDTKQGIECIKGIIRIVRAHKGLKKTTMLTSLRSALFEAYGLNGNLNNIRYLLNKSKRSSKSYSKNSTCESK